MRRFTLLAALTTVLAAVLATPLSAGASFPDRVALPNGFPPEGIAVGKGTTFYAGSRTTGAIYRGDLRTGEGAVLVPAQAGRAATGLVTDELDRLFVSGAGTGQAYVYDARTGEQIAVYQLTTPPTFINDVIVTKDGAYFTDSLKQVLYRVPISPSGELGTTVETILLTGDVVFVAGFNVNGIDATPNGDTLVVVQTNTGKLFTVDPHTGVTNEIDLGGSDVRNGDGIVLDGKTLYVVQNVNNRIAVVELDPQLASGQITGFLTHPDFDTPTTADDFGHRLYAVNARFTTPPTPAAEYWVTQVLKPTGGGDG